jgi:mannose-6-phosphate isomerase-like protein (cupin superfamily)
LRPDHDGEAERLGRPEIEDHFDLGDPPDGQVGRHLGLEDSASMDAEMARLLKASEAKRLGLPGRTSLEPVSGAIGSRVTLRIAEIPVPQPSDEPRGPHLHHDFEECIYVLRGQGTTCAESGEIPIKPGDIILIPAGEKHMTRNTGSEPLVLLCFFPDPEVTAGTTEFASF